MGLNLFTERWQELWKGVESTSPVGAVYTKPEVVDLILDLSGYTVGRVRLADRRLLEPGCGDGAFIRRIVQRLVASERQAFGIIDWPDSGLDNAIRAVDISDGSLSTARAEITTTLTAAGCPKQRAGKLADSWTLNADFLLHDFGQEKFDYVIGNPPYVRIEDLPKPVLERYRDTFVTMADRADLYVAFMERGLELLSDCGAMGLITANRFAKNAYGTAMRKIIASRYHVRYYINLEHTQPFANNVSAYPAITVIDRERDKPTRAGTLDDITPETLAAVRKASAAKVARSPLAEFTRWYSLGEPWTSTCKKEWRALDRLAADFPTLEASAPGTKVGIGVATGADRVFALSHKHPGIEASRQIPLVMAADIAPNCITWSGHYLVNPFADEDDGSLAALTEYPGLAAHLAENEAGLRSRHVAKSRPTTWYRTIDRVWPALRVRPKLLIPDIQAGGVVGYDHGQYYPHHNVYTVTSETWPLRALQALLRSTIVFSQIRAFSVQMRGGSVRYMARTLRQVRVPLLSSLDAGLLAELEQVAGCEDQQVIDAVARKGFQVPR